MKRYSVSIAYGRDRNTRKIKFHYWARTDDVENQVARYKESLASWIARLNDEGYEYRQHTNDYHGIQITDSQTKKIVYQEAHTAEEYGWKQIRTPKQGPAGTYYTISWERI